MDEAFFFESSQGGVDRARGDRPTGEVSDFIAYGHAVGVAGEAEDCKKDNLLEFTKVLSHMYDLIVVIANHKGPPVFDGQGDQKDATLEVFYRSRFPVPGAHISG